MNIIDRSSFLFFLVLTVFLCFISSQLFAGTTVTNEGIKFPDGSVQTTKAVETGIPGPQGPKGDPGFTSAICPVPKTGQTKCYDGGGNLISCLGTGQDGDLQRGFSWPNPRFTDNGDGTVTDNLTALIWLKNANCFGLKTWSTALNDCNALANGSCGLSDGSLAGDWRLPNRFELVSLTDIRFFDPVLPNTEGTAKWAEGDPFSGVKSDSYWSCTTSAFNPANAWYVYLNGGPVSGTSKSTAFYVWPVRGGQ